MKSRYLYVIIFVIIICSYDACKSEKSNSSEFGELLEQVSAQISSAGGTMVSQNGTWEMEFPPGALAESKTITVSVLPETARTIPEGYRVVTPVIQFEPHGTDFVTDVTLKVCYEQGTMAEDSIEERLIAFYYIKDDGSLEKAESVLNTSENCLEVQLPHFSIGVVLTFLISRVNSGAITSEAFIEVIADGVLYQLNLIPEGDRDAYIQANSDLLGPFSARLDEIFTDNPLVAMIDAVLNPSCTDGIMNGDETDIDCGGSCQDCVDGMACGGHGDCASGVCTNGFCCSGLCADGIMNGDETDADCGGSCSPCLSGQNCLIESDCLSLICELGLCRDYSCYDGIMNGDETDVDCGGTCPDCADGMACSGHGDCSSSVCTNGFCCSGLCADGIMNGDETDADCGGSCSPCLTGQNCFVDSDCLSLNCDSGTGVCSD